MNECNYVTYYGHKALGPDDRNMCEVMRLSTSISCMWVINLDEYRIICPLWWEGHTYIDLKSVTPIVTAITNERFVLAKILFNNLPLTHLLFLTLSQCVRLSIYLTPFLSITYFIFVFSSNAFC